MTGHQEAAQMEELSTTPIPGPTLAEDHRRPPAHASPRQPERRLRIQSVETEANEQQDETPENSEPKHDLDISV